MKKVSLIAVVASVMLLTSCTGKMSSLSKNSVPFPGMTVSRADYKLSSNVTSEVEVKEWSALFGLLRGAKVVGEQKNQLREGNINGYNLDAASKIAVYKLLDENPDFDYLTNIRVSKDYTEKMLVLFTTYNTKVKVVARGITLKTEK